MQGAQKFRWGKSLKWPRPLFSPGILYLSSRRSHWFDSGLKRCGNNRLILELLTNICPKTFTFWVIHEDIIFPFLSLPDAGGWPRKGYVCWSVSLSVFLFVLFSYPAKITTLYTWAKVFKFGIQYTSGTLRKVTELNITSIGHQIMAQ